jgi:hypothetical protein
MGIAFDEFWELYPRKVGKIDAEKSYGKAMKLATIDQIREGAKKFAARCQNTEPQYIPHPATWLNAGRWDDQPMAAPDRTFGPRQFPPERRSCERPRALTWANVWVPADSPQYQAMLARAAEVDTDPREYLKKSRGIWVSRLWLERERVLGV